jgi:hypothetical protein
MPSTVCEKYMHNTRIEENTEVQQSHRLSIKKLCKQIK